MSDLDRHITGNYGEDFFRGYDDLVANVCNVPDEENNHRGYRAICDNCAWSGSFFWSPDHAEEQADDHNLQEHAA